MTTGKGDRAALRAENERYVRLGRELLGMLHSEHVDLWSYSMRLVLPSNDRVCVPFRIVDGAGAPGAWLGGRPPDTVAPAGSEIALRYFATVPLALEPTACVSIFAADLEQLMGARGGINEPGLVQPVLHAPRPRRTTRSAIDSGLSEHALLLLDASDDWVIEDGEEIVRPEHKIGGRPHLVRERPKLLASVGSILEQGYVLVAQFDFPSRSDAKVAGDWPFADGMFALFGREPFGEQHWRWYWDF